MIPSAPLPPAAASLLPFVTADVLTDADLRIAERIGRLGGDGSEPVLLATALALRGLRFGHVCVELARVADLVAVEPRPGGDGGADGGVEVGADVGADGGADGGAEVSAADALPLRWPEAADWEAALVASPLVREGGTGETPLVLEAGRLYLDRYWSYEQRLAGALVARAARPVGGVDAAALRGWLDELFPRDHGEEADETEPGLDRQRLAVALSLLRHLTVIAGGPGTGKTYTVTRMLALLHRHAMVHHPDRPLRVALAAPTGKAAARLQESLREGLAQLTLEPEVRDALLRTPAYTLHRLLGTSRGSSTRFRHDAGDPLPHDVVIVDEASMVSLPLMAKLVDAVRPDARLVLLGDRDQLASVEAGAAFGDICGPEGSRPVLRLSADAAAELTGVLDVDVAAEAEPAPGPGPGVWDAIVRLDRFRRFGPTSPLGAVARAIQHSGEDVEDALSLLRAGTLDEAGEGVELLDPDRHAGARGDCEARVVDAYTRCAELALGGAEAVEVLDALAELRVLCALRRGPDGARAWNEAIEQRLGRRVDGFRADQPWYVGRPILVTENDYAVRLYNGDVGVILRDPRQPDRRVAAFRTTDGSVRLLSPARLPACETTFAMTVHKSQGSQFTHAVVVLPTVPSPILTRELVYTAITRSTARTTLLAREPILREALSRPVQRASGLQHRLWGAGASPAGGAGPRP